MVRAAMLLWPAITLVVACSGPQTSGDPQSQAAAATGGEALPAPVKTVLPAGTAETDDGCAAYAARFGRECFALDETRWEFTNMMPTETSIDRLVFQRGGRLAGWHVEDPSGKHTDNTWEQNGTKVHFWLNDEYSEYTGELDNDMEMSGPAKNIRGESWTWRAVRLLD